jgi:putative resolvase
VPARQTATGTILVDEPRGEQAGGVALYARVSSSDQREDLERQLGRLAAWATAQGLGVTVTVAEIGSGLNGSRSKLKRLLSDRCVATIVVEHRRFRSGTGRSGDQVHRRHSRPRTRSIPAITRLR